MKVLQVIDSLNTGGAERVAVNYANLLAEYVEVSSLCTTRAEGLLKKDLLKKVQYLFLNKKSTFDFNAIKKINSFIKRNEIDILHAHASSFFIATIIKLLNPQLSLIWHEHYGNREESSKRDQFILKICSYFFSCIITVNKNLKIRSEAKLLSKKVYVLENYPVINASIKQTVLKGSLGKRIICLANLRPDKDHLNLINAYNKVNKYHSDWSLHLVGKFYDDDYHNLIKELIFQLKLENNVFIYGSCVDVNHILKQSDIAVLSSKSEGLPLALLEYGLSSLPVVATNVGDCSRVISSINEGVLVESENYKALADGLLRCIESKGFRNNLGRNLYLKISTSFTERNTLESLMEIYKFSKT